MSGGRAARLFLVSMLELSSFKSTPSPKSSPEMPASPLLLEPLLSFRSVTALRLKVDLSQPVQSSCPEPGFFLRRKGIEVYIVA